MRIAIVGSGPTALFTLSGLAAASSPLHIIIFEAGELSGTGGPYSPAETDKLLLANIASIELPAASPSFAEWLRAMPADRLAIFGVVPKDVDERAFLPRVLLGAYLRDQMRRTMDRCASLGHRVEVFAETRVVDIAATIDGYALSALHAGGLLSVVADHVVLATGHQWSDDDAADALRFASPWPTTKLAGLPAGRIGILGASLSGIDAALAVASQHGRFHGEGDDLAFYLNDAAEGLRLTLMSRKGLLPEADFYVPIPHDPLRVVTPKSLERIARSPSEGRLDRVFALVAREISVADPNYAAAVGLDRLDADSFAAGYFAERLAADPFDYAARNLAQVRADAAARRVSGYRYALLRLHEAVEPLVADFSERDRSRFADGLAQVFVDNYAAVPPRTVARLMALHRTGCLDLLRLGPDYDLDAGASCGAVIRTDNRTLRFDALIDARGQRALVLDDLPFPTLRRQLRGSGAAGSEPLDLGADLSLQPPSGPVGKIYCAAAPYLLHRQPFAQGLTVCHRLGETVSASLLSELAGRPGAPAATAA